MIVAATETSSETAARTVLVWVPEQKAVAERVVEALQLRGARAVLLFNPVFGRSRGCGEQIDIGSRR